MTLMFLQMVWKSPMTHDEAPRSSTDNDLDSGDSDSRTGRPEQLVTQPSGSRRGSFQALRALQLRMMVVPDTQSLPADGEGRSRL